MANTRVEIRDAETPRSLSPTPATKAAEDRQVTALLEQADRQGGGVESAAGLPFDAYRGLARSRGVSLEAVIRAVVRDELRDIVTMPKVRRSVGNDRAPRSDPKARVDELARRRGGWRGAPDTRAR
jgi:hypothetical protein